MAAREPDMFPIDERGDAPCDERAGIYVDAARVGEVIHIVLALAELAAAEPADDE